MTGEKQFTLFLTEDEHKAIKECSHLRVKSMQVYIKDAIKKENTETLSKIIKGK